MWRSKDADSTVDPRMEPTMWFKAGLGILLCAVGTVFILQGTNVLHGSGMSGEGKWALVGIVAVVAGLSILAHSFLSRKSDSPESG
jgi:uncharacterized membrane protein HdeD (DUF308 family)